MGGATVSVSDERLVGLLKRTLAGIPRETPPMRSLRKIQLKRRGDMPGLVGLTKWGRSTDSGDDRGAVGLDTAGRQTITFYSWLLSQLSDNASVAVIAHELAHAWLNEHVRPEDSSAREAGADALARQWGFGRELDALELETEPV